MSKRRLPYLDEEVVCRVWLPDELVLHIFSFVRDTEPEWLLDVLTRVRKPVVRWVKTQDPDSDHVEWPDPWPEPWFWPALRLAPLNHLLETMQETSRAFRQYEMDGNGFQFRQHITSLSGSRDSFPLALVRYLSRIDVKTTRIDLSDAINGLTTLSHASDHACDFLRFAVYIKLEWRLLFPRDVGPGGDYPWVEKSFVELTPFSGSLLRHVYLVDYAVDPIRWDRMLATRLTPLLQTKLRVSCVIRERMDTAGECRAIVERCDKKGLLASPLEYVISALPGRQQSRRAVVFEHCRGDITISRARGDDPFCNLVIDEHSPLLTAKTRDWCDLATASSENEEEKEESVTGYCHIYSRTAKQFLGRLCVIIGGEAHAQRLLRLYNSRQEKLDDFYSLLVSMGTDHTTVKQTKPDPGIALLIAAMDPRIDLLLSSDDEEEAPDDATVVL